MNFGVSSVTAAAALAALLLAGCSSTKTSNTARTAKEQLLLSNAVEQSLNKVDFSPLYNQKVYLDEKYLECVDKPFVVGSLRHRVMLAGGFVVAKPEDAQVVMEVRSGAVGTDTNETFLGTPEIALPGMLTIPEIRLAERKSQFGYAKLGMVLYDASSKKILGSGGVATAESNDSNSYVMGVGPFQNGSLRREITRARESIPGMNRREMPTTVAFEARRDTPEEMSMQFASESKDPQ